MKDAAALITDHVLPVLDTELERIHKLVERRTLDREDTSKLVDLTRAAVALRYVDLRVADAERKAGKGDDLKDLTVEELLARAQELMRNQGLDPSPKGLSLFRAGGKQ